MFNIPVVQIFEPLTYTDALAVLSQFDLTKQQEHEVYQDWLGNFRHQARLFYLSEKRTLQAAAEDYGYSDESLQSVLDRYNEEMERYSNERDLASPPMSITEWPAFEYFVASINGGFAPWIYNDELFAAWFDYVALPPQKDYVVRGLRQMPYPDYLKTDHWRRVRSAVLITRGSKCDRQDCSASWEGAYFGDQVDLHVHHLTYANRGRERYADLELLCSQCHAKEHGL